MGWDECECDTGAVEAAEAAGEVTLTRDEIGQVTIMISKLC